MNMHADHKPVKTMQSAASSVHHQKSGSAGFYHVDNRPTTVAQRKLQHTASTPATHDGPVLQKKGFADPANPNTTRQWEGTGYISRDAGEERPQALAALVDQFKKEMLTYIAHYISSRKAARYYGPHIAVIITGSNWNVSVNSDVADARQRDLQADANAAKAHIDQCWESLDNTYGNLFTTKTWFENNAVEAAYIAFRWAAGKSSVRAIANAGPARDRRVHGEMRIIDQLQQAAPDAYTPLHPDSMHPVAVAPNAPLPASYRRVVRVGGTKTPCFDCAWEMNKVATHDDAQANHNTDGNNAHGHDHEAHMVGEGPNERVASTMSPTFGPSFPTWQSPDATHGRRTAPLALGGVANFQQNQGQDYAALQAAYVTSGCAPAMI